MFARRENTVSQQGFIKRLRKRLNQGDSWLTYDLANLAPGGKIDEDVLDELEALLVMADVGIDTTERIITDLQESLARKELNDVAALRAGLHRALTAILDPVSQPLEIPHQENPFVVLMVGVNGAGKTTTIGKLAKRFRDQGMSVMLAAGDTFRAAAQIALIEDPEVWFKFIRLRNLTVHTYNEDTFNEIYSELPEFEELLTAFTKQIEAE